MSYRNQFLTPIATKLIYGVLNCPHIRTQLKLVTYSFLLYLIYRTITSYRRLCGFVSNDIITFDIPEIDGPIIRPLIVEGSKRGLRLSQLVPLKIFYCYCKSQDVNLTTNISGDNYLHTSPSEGVMFKHICCCNNKFRNG